MINFPATAGQPTDGSFTHSEVGLTWTWNGTTWDVEGGGGGEPATPIVAGTGLTGGTITDSGTVALDTAYTDARYVNLTGDTMTGNLTVPSLNGGQLAGFRNVLINGNLTVNQRGVTIAAAAVGAYGPDRWKKVDAGNMTQIVEDGNFVPGATYTLSGTGVTTQQLTAPATGNWTLPNIPITATKIQLEPGTVATPFEQRTYGAELVMCQRYFETFDAGGVAPDGVTFTANNYSPGTQPVCPFYYKVTKRVAPSISCSGNGTIRYATNTGIYLNAPLAVFHVSLNGFSISCGSAPATSFGFMDSFGNIYISAEL
jgi:hypothetical protein